MAANAIADPVSVVVKPFQNYIQAWHRPITDAGDSDRFCSYDLEVHQNAPLDARALPNVVKLSLVCDNVKNDRADLHVREAAQRRANLRINCQRGTDNPPGRSKRAAAKNRSREVRRLARPRGSRRFQTESVFSIV